MEEEIKLVLPDLEHEQKAHDFLKEHYDNGEEEINGDGGLDHCLTYEDWVQEVRDNMSEATVADGLVAATTYFAMLGDEIIGTIQIRHRLNEFLKNFGGHIGYSIKPSQRQKGYGTQMLKLAIAECEKLGITEILITCDKGNVASAKTIEKCGGIFENEIYDKENDKYVERYWIRI